MMCFLILFDPSYACDWVSWKFNQLKIGLILSDVVLTVVIPSSSVPKWHYPDILFYLLLLKYHLQSRINCIAGPVGYHGCGKSLHLLIIINTPAIFSAFCAQLMPDNNDILVLTGRMWRESLVCVSTRCHMTVARVWLSYFPLLATTTCVILLMQIRCRLQQIAM